MFLVLFVVSLVAGLMRRGPVAIDGSRRPVVRVSFIEAACIVAIGVAMVELHGGNRSGAPAVIRQPRWRRQRNLLSPARLARIDALDLAPNESYR